MAHHVRDCNEFAARERMCTGDFEGVPNDHDVDHTGAEPRNHPPLSLEIEHGLVAALRPEARPARRFSRPSGLRPSLVMVIHRRRALSVAGQAAHALLITPHERPRPLAVTGPANGLAASIR
jgi:hypothetical protein